MPRSRITDRIALPAVCLLLGALACGDDTTSAAGSSTGGTDTSMPTQTGDPTTVTDTQGTATGTATDTSTDTETGSDTGDEPPPLPAPPEGTVVDCDGQVPAAPAGEVCGVVPGDGTLLIRGTILAGTTSYTNGSMVVDTSGPNGVITCVGCDCAAAGATEINCADGVISPGLVNPHDHITFSLSQPQDHSTERYDHRHEWREGLNGATEINVFPGRDNSHEGILYGELRMLFGAATSVTGSIGGSNASGLVRNLDSAGSTEGLSGVDVNYRTFPLGDSGGELLSSGCGYPSIDATSNLNADIYMPHVAEGVGAWANNEFQCMSSAAQGEDLIEENTSIVHGIGMRAQEVETVGLANAKLVWSPRSNIDLYGITADVLTYHHLGATIALGTDWSASGSMNMLRELKCADNLNANHLDSAFSNLEMWLMATYWSAVSQGADDQIGLLRTGHIADIAIFDGSTNDRYRAVIDADNTDVALVLRGGHPLYGDTSIIEGLVPAAEVAQCESFDMCGTHTKRVCAERDAGITMAAIQAAVNQNAYDLFACGEPEGEPSCNPARPMEFPAGEGVQDQDGDGIADIDDNCPAVFNPLRPLDNGIQADFDQDGTGDACDVCPTMPGFDCTIPDSFDQDGDAIADFDDNCPFIANADQADQDNDQSGDACDDCPDIPNPGGSLCPASIYSVKDGTVDFGASVRITDAVVTAAVDGTGFFLQVHPDDADYVGVDWSGLYVYVGGGPVQPVAGDRINVDGQVQDWFGQTQMSASSVEILSSGNPLPDAEVTTVAEIIEGGSAQAELEAVLVTVLNVTVTDIAPPVGPGDNDPTQEFEVTGGLRVNDFFYLLEPFPTVGVVYPSLSGVARWANDFTKLEPRGPEDLPVTLVGVGSGEEVFLGEGVTAVPSPGLQVQLSRVAPVAVDVALTYSNVAVLTGPATVTIPAGSNSADLVLTGGTAGTATVTATLEANAFVASVRVYNDAEPRLPTLSPAVVGLGLNALVELTLSLDLPAPAGGTTATLASVPGTGITMPASVTVPANATEATFTVTAGAVPGVETLTATAPDGSDSVTITIIDNPVFADLVLSEVYYDHPGGDDQYEWVKIYNGTGGDVDLAGYSLGWGGNDYTYGTLQLAGTIAAGECFVVGGPLGNADSGFPGAVAFDQVSAPALNMQNSGANADAVGLFDIDAAAIGAGSIPVSAVIYGVANANNLADENGANGAVDVDDAPSGDSVRLQSDGTWVVNATPQPAVCLPLPMPV